jgi:hypothetical protein
MKHNDLGEVTSTIHHNFFNNAFNLQNKKMITMPLEAHADNKMIGNVMLSAHGFLSVFYMMVYIENCLLSRIQLVFKYYSI